jgi:hypothetical protein
VFLTVEEGESIMEIRMLGEEALRVIVVEAEAETAPTALAMTDPTIGAMPLMSTYLWKV